MKELKWIKKNKREGKIKLDLKKVDAYFIMGIKRGKKNISYFDNKVKGIFISDMANIIRLFYEQFKGTEIYKPITYLKRG